MTNKILLIEDDDTHIAIVSEIIAKEFPSSTLLVEKEPANAVHILNDEKIALVVLDIMLGRKNGLEYALKLIQTQSQPIVIVMSALSDRETIEAANLLGVDDYVCKPFDVKAFVALIRSKLV